MFWILFTIFIAIALSFLIFMPKINDLPLESKILKK